ncbi:MAG: alpha/beta hydrolase [Candidatus Zixiibacteriota bacterium]|nr:MAG: alpha/beta hydrolase [candidate division Zixibacteria bacterium]
MLRRIFRIMLWLVITVLGVVVALLAFLYFGQGKIIFIPSRSIDATPADAGLAYEDVYIEVDDGVQIHGWYARQNSSAPTVLFCHGNAGNISHRISTAQMLNELGVNYLMFDYRGYGRSGGSPSEENAYGDAAAAYRWLRTEKGVPAESLFVFGRSLGGAVGVELSTAQDCAGLILESTFTSISDMGKRIYPFLPVKLLVRYRFASIEKMSRVKCPLLVAHSADDELIPYEMGKRLYEAGSEPKGFVEFSGGHNDLDCLHDEKYRRSLREFLELDEPL